MLRPSTTTMTTHRLLLALTLGVAVLLLVAGCRQQRGTTRVPEESGPLEPGSFRAAWVSSVDTSRYGALDRIFLRDNLLLVYTERNIVYVFSATGGQAQWLGSRIARPLERLWPPVLLDAQGRFEDVERILAFPLATAYVIYSDTGTRLQQTPIDREERTLTSPSFGYEGLVYAGLTDARAGRAAIIDPTRPFNSVLVPRRTEGVIISRPVVYNGIFFVADDFGRVYGITREGNPQWDHQHFATGGSIRAALTADEDGLYVPSTDSILYVLDRNTGRLRWRFFSERPLTRAAFPTREHVFQPTETRGVVCLSKTTGGTVGREPLWTAEDALDVLSHDDQNVYLLYRDGAIVAHSKSTGEELFRSRRTDFTRFARNYDGATIYAGRTDGELVAIEPVLRRGQVGRMVEAPIPQGQQVPLAVVQP